MNMFKSTNAKTPAEYIALLPEPRKTEIRKLHNLIRQTVPQLTPHFQSGMIGYGTFHYKYATGREGDWFIVGLASNKNYISLYVNAGDGKKYVSEKYKSLLPKANIGKSCIRFKKMADVDLTIIRKLLHDGETMMKPR